MATVGLKFSTGFTSFILITIGMLVSNGVILLFWHASEVSKSMENTLQKLHLLARIYEQNQKSSSTQFQQLLLDVVNLDEATCAIVHGQIVHVVGENKACISSLGQIVEKVQVDKQDVRLFSSNPVLSFLKPYSFAYIAVFVKGNSSSGGALGLGIPLQVFWQRVFESEQVIAVYLMVNALILAIIAFFRMSKIIHRPMDKLIASVAELSYNEKDVFAFGKNASEFGQLSAALSTMMSTINKDREVLKRNIAELEKVNQELSETRADMIHAEKLAAVGKLSAGLAHEIGNPLGIVLGFLGLLDQSGLTELERKDYVKRAEAELGRIHRLIRQLLDYSRSSDDKRVASVVHINSILRNAVELIGLKEKTKIEFTLDLSPDPDIVLASEDSLQQVFMNCLLNATEAIGASGKKEQGSITVASSLQVMEEGPFIVVTIEDNGIGASEENLSMVFDPFFTTKPVGSGTGLGLSISSAIIEELGGKIIMENALVQGIKVSIFLPLVSENENLL